MNNAAAVAAKTSTDDLRRIVKTIDNELIAAIDRGVRGTQAHVGQIELMEACSAELRARRSAGWIR